MAFPSTLYNPTPLTATSSDLPYVRVNTDETEIVGVQTKLGINGSGDTTTVDFKLSGILASDKAASLTGTEVLTNKTLTAPTLTGATLTIKDNAFTIQDDWDTTKQLVFQASGISTSTTRTLTAPDASTTIVGTDTTQTITNKTIGVTNLLNFHAPQGYLINGQINVAVASNNLTVSLFTNRNGTAPSATDPFYTRIANTPRTGSASIAVTKNAATNWCNAGASELATLAIDYFVYVIWNTGPVTPVLDIGFSRISSGKVYSDFSGTSTNEQYLAYGNATQPNSTDNVELLGKFTATLSAGAGYTWSISGTGNVINRPVYDTDWMTWAPTLVGFSANPTSTVYRYRMRNGVVDLQYNEGANGTSSTTGFTATLPMTALTLTNYTVVASASAFDNGSQLTSPARASIGSAGTTLSFAKDWSGAAWTNANGKRCVATTISYRYV